MPIFSVAFSYENVFQSDARSRTHIAGSGGVENRLPCKLKFMISFKDEYSDIQKSSFRRTKAIVNCCCLLQPPALLLAIHLPAMFY